MNEPRPLHRLFGLSWIDFCEGTSLSVETELDLSVKQQFLDLVLIRHGPGPLPSPMPDGFEELAAHNLVTFKSHQETLDAWPLWELIGHFVNYRKQSSPALHELLPVSDYKLFAVCARYPQNLEPHTELIHRQEGVYDVRTLGLTIRIIVAGLLPCVENNAMLHLFSARDELLRYGQAHYRLRSRDTSSVLSLLLETYYEDPAMSDKLKEFLRQSMDELLAKLPPEERLKGLPPEERLKGLPAEERLKGLPAEERLKGLTDEELLRALPPERLEALTRRRKANGATEKSPQHGD